MSSEEHTSVTDTPPVPWPELFFPALDSTMDEARRFASGNGAALDAFRVRSGIQWRGRGRRGRVWFDRPGESVLTTLAIRRHGPCDPQDPNPGTLALRIGAAVLRVVRAVVACDDLRIKWPNDILVGSRKLCGILVEADSRWFLVGIGINGAQPVGVRPDAASTDAQADPISLCELGWRGGYHDLVSLMDVSLARCLAGCEWYRTVADHLAWRGEPVVVSDSHRRVSGVVTGIDRDGSLLLDTTGGTVRVVSGTLRKAPTS